MFTVWSYFFLLLPVVLTSPFWGGDMTDDSPESIKLSLAYLGVILLLGAVLTFVCWGLGMGLTGQID